ncbi:MAG: DUF3576 domain-containing protein [Alphaproteobacteria bacterium]|nr:DUF3576 domain-containing protein [Alphaproteobacteria bacterium]
MKKTTFTLLAIIATSALLTLNGCSGINTEAKYPTGADRASTETNGGIYAEAPTIWGNGKSLLNQKGDEAKSEGITVNSFLWHAALDTVSFMPLASADPFGGTILTDWHSDTSAPHERIKLNVFILGKELKGSAVKVTVFKQVKTGTWVNVDPAPETARKLEDAILTRARQLRIAQLDRK